MVFIAFVDFYKTVEILAQHEHVGIIVPRNEASVAHSAEECAARQAVGNVIIAAKSVNILHYAEYDFLFFLYGKFCLVIHCQSLLKG